MVRGSNPGGREIFHTRPDRPRGPPSLLYNGYRVSFSGVKWPGRGVDHPSPSSAEVKERVKLYLYSPSGQWWPVIGWTLPLHWFRGQGKSVQWLSYIRGVGDRDFGVGFLIGARNFCLQPSRIHSGYQNPPGVKRTQNLRHERFYLLFIPLLYRFLLFYVKNTCSYNLYIYPPPNSSEICKVWELRAFTYSCL